MNAALKRLVYAEDGAASVEYSLVALLVALAVIAGVAAVGTNVAAMYSDVASRLPAVPAS